MSEGCSSHWDLNIAPRTITAVTLRLIVTFWPRLCKGDLKLTHSLQMFFTSAAKQRQRHIFKDFLGFEVIVLRSDSLSLYHLHSFVWGFIWAPENCVNVREVGRWRVPTTIGQLNVSQHLMVWPEVTVCWIRSQRPPTCVVVQLGHVSAAGHCSAAHS